MARAPQEKDHTTANRMTVFCFSLRSRNRGMATGTLPRGFVFSPWFGLSYGALAIVYSSLVNRLVFLMVLLPLFIHW